MKMDMVGACTCLSSGPRIHPDTPLGIPPPALYPRKSRDCSKLIHYYTITPPPPTHPLHSGTVLVFDELFNYPDYRDGELFALYDLLHSRSGLAAEVMRS